MKQIIILFFFLPLTSLFGAPKKGETTFEYTKRIHKQIEEVRSLTADDYASKIDQYREDIENFIEHKKRVCNGEFSTIVLGEKKISEEIEEASKKTHKLGQEEKKLCFREMKALQVTFVNNMYLARKNYLEDLHKKRIKELGDARDKALRSLQESFDKKSRR